MSYLQFEPHGRSASGKTLIVAVRDRAGSPLGAITWYAPWRKYVFEARPDTVWDASCLRDVAAHCEAMTTAHGLEGPALPAPEPSPLERPTLYSEMLEALAWMAKLAETDEGAAIVLNRLRQRVAEVRSSIPVRAAPEPWEIVARNGRVWVESSRGRIDCDSLLDAERIADALKALDRVASAPQPERPPA